MASIDEARFILKMLGLSAAQQNEMSALTLLALSGLRPGDEWSQAQRHRLTISKGIMDFVFKEYGKPYAPNTRETFRRQVLHQFVLARVADYNPFEPDLPTNSPRSHYALTEAALEVIRSYGTERWEPELRKFIHEQKSSLALYQKERSRRAVPVQLPERTSLELSPGKHNQLQRDVVELFVPRFVPGARLLYLGDAAKKNLHIDTDRLARLSIPISEHDKLPDIILYDEERNWLYLIEAVTSHGPMTRKRVTELEMMLANCPAGVILISAFPSFTEFRKHLKEIAWETEVWLAEIPDHLIHFNGDRFLGPHRSE